MSVSENKNGLYISCYHVAMSGKGLNEIEHREVIVIALSEVESGLVRREALEIYL